MAILVPDLVAKTRLDSGLRGNATTFTDDDIASILTDGYREVRDQVMAANEHHLLKPFFFTLKGGIGQNFVALPPGFIQEHGVDIDPNTSSQRGVPMLSAWLDRNRPRAPCGLQFAIVDQKLIVTPAESAAGNYRLWYTAVAPDLVVTPAKTASGSTSGVYTSDGINSATLVLAAMGFDASDVGRVVTLILSPPYEAFSGEYRVTSDTNTTTVVTGPGPAGTVTSAVAWTAYVNNFGKTNVIVDATEAWASTYLPIYASIAIRTSRRQPTEDLERKLTALKGRIASASANRTEEPVQPPLTRNRRWGGGYYGGGF